MINVLKESNTLRLTYRKGSIVIKKKGKGKLIMNATDNQKYKYSKIREMNNYKSLLCILKIDIVITTKSQFIHVYLTRAIKCINKHYRNSIMISKNKNDVIVHDDKMSNNNLLYLLREHKSLIFVLF